MKTAGIEEARPGDPTYEDVSLGWNTLYKHHPAVVRLPKTQEEAATCLKEAIDAKQPFRIRSGGHDVNGYSSADGVVVIDLRNLNSIVVSEDESLVTVEPAARFRNLYPALSDHKLVVPAGICTDVAVGGHALGGGNGYLHRYLGASCDKIVDMKLVDWQGNIIHANAKENPDLFWALRGAGNMNFGMVLEYTYSTTRIETFSTFALTWTWDDYDRIFQLWQNWAPFADTRLTSTFTLYKDEITAMGLFAGSKQELISLLPPFITEEHKGGEALGIDEYDRYDHALDGLMSHYVQGDNSVSHEHATFAAAATMCKLLPEETLPLYRDNIRNSPGTSSTVFFARGGRICGVPADFNAYRYRTQKLEPMFRTTWKDGGVERDACLQWIVDSYEKFKPGFEGVYKNWTYSKVKCGMLEWYGENIPRLVAVKRKYDPQNLFFNEQSLPTEITIRQVEEWKLPEGVVDVLREQGSLVE